jgi:hypothetical protein
MVQKYGMGIPASSEEEWSALADDFRTLLVQGSLEIDGLETFALVSA